MADVFISYAREDADFVHRLHGELQARGRESWVDFEGIPPSAEWLAEIRAAIDAADSFLFVLTPDSAASEVCGQELAHAVAQNKKFVPLLRREVAGDRVPQHAAKLNWIYFRDHDDFARATDALIESLQTDLDWVREHTLLLRKAGEWERARRDASFTLRGSELARFEEWIARAPDMEPKPTGLQSQFVLASRRAATRRQRLIWGSVAVGLAVAAGLSVATWLQSRERQRQTEIALARQLINRAEGLRERPPDEQSFRYREQSAVAAVQALARFEGLGMRSLEADQAVRRSMALLPWPLWEEDLPGSVDAAAFDPSGRYLAIARRTQITLWDVVERTSKRCEWSPGGAAASNRAVAVDPAGAAVAVATYNASNEDEYSAVTVLGLADCSRGARARLPGRRERLRFGAAGRAFALLGGGYDPGPVWETETGAELTLGHEALEVSDLAFHPRAARLAVLVRRGREATVTILDTSLPQAEAVASWDTRERARRLRWTGDGSSLLMAGYGRAGVRVHEPETGKGAGKIDVPWKDLLAGPEAGLVGLAGKRRVEVRDATSGRRVAEVPLQARVEAMAFAPPGHESLVILGEGGSLTAWSLTGGRWLVELRHSHPVSELMFSLDSTLLLARSEVGLDAWELSASSGAQGLFGPSSREAVPPPPRPYRARVEGRAVGSGEQRVVIVDSIGGAQVDELELDRRVLGAAVSPDGERIALSVGQITRGGWQIELQVRDLGSRELLTAVSLEPSLRNRLEGLLEFSPDGRYLATASPDGIMIREFDTLDRAYDLFHPSSAQVFFQELGTLVATVGRNGQVRVWDLGDTATEIVRLDHDLVPADVALSPDGRWLVAAAGPRVRLWALRAQDLIAQACARVSLDCP